MEHDAGLPLGIDPDVDYAETTVSLSPRATAMLYTDGLTEARDNAGQLFGENRLAAWLTETAPEISQAADAVTSLQTRLNSFRGPESLSDDQTFILLHHRP